MLTHRRRGIPGCARFYHYKDPYDTPVDSSPSTSSDIGGVAVSSGAVPAVSPAPSLDETDAESDCADFDPLLPEKLPMAHP